MKKKFDCIQMKREIQEKMLQETHLLNDTERMAFYKKALEKESGLSAYIQKLHLLKVKEAVS